jgi:uncharacterized protein YdeI (YjbR/CyaY-like superfamily)
MNKINVNNNPKVDSFIEKAKTWRDEYILLREILLQFAKHDANFKEEYKWGKPCYSLDGENIVLIHGFKEYCALLFFNGALLNDDAKQLVQQTENVQAARQLRFTKIGEIKSQENMIINYIQNAIEVRKSGAKFQFKSASEFTMPCEFKTALENNNELHNAFYKLTQGRQKAYLLYFGGAKQEKTRQSRIEKYIPKILNGLGFDD